MLATVSASALNVRAIPSIVSHVMGVLPEGTTVKIVGSNDDWYEIPYQNSTGFISRHYVTQQNNSRFSTGITLPTLLNVRAQPALSADLLATLSEGTRVNILAHLDQCLEIEFNNDVAYVAADYVEVFPASQRAQVEITVETLNVRSGPSTGASILGHFSRGIVLQIIQSYGNWLAFVFNGNTAYVHKKFTRPVAEDEALPLMADVLEETAPEMPVSQSDAVATESNFPLIRQLPVIGSPQQQKVARTWNRFGALLQQLSQRMGIDVACAVAVLCVESSGKGFEENNQGRMIIRFENHIFRKYWGRQFPQQFSTHFQYQSGQAWKGHRWRSTDIDPWQSFHGNQVKEWQVYDFARSLDADAAMYSISMGLPQIMGFNYQRIGYPSVGNMFVAFSNDIAAQINGLFDFFDDRMIRNLQSLDFVSFAGAYNGSGQKEKYGKWIDDHYRAFKALQHNLS